MESQPQNPEFKINPENFHPCVYYPTIRSLYHHVVCNVLVSCKANGDRNPLGAWLVTLY